MYQEPRQSLRIIHIARQFFDNCSGAERYVYELGRAQVKQGHDVLVASPIQGGELRIKSAVAGIQVISPSEVLFSKPDILHIHNAHVIVRELTHKTPSIATLHDANDSIERGNIRRWIVVREELASLLPGSVTHIPNGFDFTRFKPLPLPSLIGGKKLVLAAGNFRDDRRTPMLDDLRRQARAGSINLRLVGLGVSRIKDPGVSIWPITWDIERHVAECHETAGIYLGRVTIEGWLCGRPGWIYDEHGNKEIKPVPGQDVLAKYDINVTSRLIEDVYREVII